MSDHYYSDEYKPISAWGYIGYEILFAIPVVGFVFAIIFAIGAHNRNLRNYARSKFCMIILVCIIYGIAAVLGVLGG